MMDFGYPTVLCRYCFNLLPIPAAAGQTPSFVQSFTLSVIAPIGGYRAHP